MEDFDKHWNFGDPASTEIKFREILTAGNDKSPDYKLQLQTQIARTYSLRAMFDQAHSILDEVEKQLPSQHSVVHVRYHLERGRTFTSSRKKAEAKIHFELAQSIADELKEESYSIDALHMLAIISPVVESIQLMELAIVKLENSSDAGARNWLGSLFNNLGWSYFDLGNYDKALSIFLRALKWREEQKSAPEIFLAKWCIAANKPFTSFSKIPLRERL